MIRRLIASAVLVGFCSGTALAAGDPASGKALFGRCVICHKTARDAGNGLGPNLFGVGGRKAGAIAGFAYSTAMKNSAITWTEDKLEAYVRNPKTTVPGNRMAFAGISDQKQAQDLAAYLMTLK